MLSVRCLSCPSVLSVTFVHCGQTVGRIKMKLGMQVGLGPGRIVLGGDPAPPPLKGHSPAIFGQYLLRPNGDFVLDGDPAPPPQKGGRAPAKFSAMFIAAKRLDG